MKTTKKKVFCAVLFSLLALIYFVIPADAQDFKIRGRLHMDAFYGINDADAFSNGFNNRRARMGMNGQINEKWDGRIEVDFADGGVSPNDFRLRRSFDHGGRLWLGQFKVPQGLNELTSSNEITFIERSAQSNIFTDSRRIGIAYQYFLGAFGLKSMVYGRALGQIDYFENDIPLGAAFRGVFFPEVRDGNLHVGASVAYEDLRDNNKVRFSDRPEARDSKGGRIRFVDARIDNAESTLKTGLELLYLNGPFSIEGEYLRAAVSRKQDNSSALFGYHVQTSYILTGESRSYSGGYLGTVTPTGDAGAWEVAMRYSYVYLNDAGIMGGEQSNITMGLNHYVTSKFRFMCNVILVNLDYFDERPLLGLLRAQYNF